MTTEKPRGPKRALGLAPIVAALVACFACGCRGSRAESTGASPAASAPSSPAVDGAATWPLDFVEQGGAGADLSRPLPLVVAVHGLGDAPERFADILDGLPVAARIVLPRGPEPWHDGFAWFKVPFFDGDWEPFSAPIARAADQVARLIAALVARRPNSGRPVLTGFSQGGMISFAVAVRHPEAIGLAVPISGVLPRSLWPAGDDRAKRYPPIHAIHGKADDIVPIAAARRTVEHLTAAGATADLRAFPGVGHTVTEAMRREIHALIAGAVSP